jgi:UDP-glucuronate decarboxylase
LAEAIRGEINPSLPILRKTLPQDDPLQRQPVINLAHEHLQWHPTVELKEGLQLTIDWFRERLLEEEAS